MKDLASVLKTMVVKLLQVELGSVAGKVNLLGGVVLTLLVGAIVINSFLTQLINAALQYFGKGPLPALSNLDVLLAIGFVGLFFYMCVRVISALEDSRK